MTNIPATAREFERWMGDVDHAWPDDLQRLGKIALLTLQSMIGQERQFEQSAALREASAKDLMAFAEAYGAWAAREQG